MKHSFLKHLCLICCLLLYGSTEAQIASQSSGQIVIYLERISDLSDKSNPQCDFALELKKIVLVGTSESAEITPLVGKIYLQNLSSHQMLLAESVIDPGDYHQLLLDIFQIPLSSNHADSLIPHNHPELTIPLEVSIGAGETETLFLESHFSAATDTQKYKTVECSQIRKHIPPETSLAFVSNEASNNLTIIDRAIGEVVGGMRVGEGPRGMAISKQQGMLFVANSQSNTISVNDISSRQPIDIINLDWGDEPEAVAVSGDSRFLFVANRGSNSVTIIELPSFMIVAKVTVGMEPVDVAADRWNNLAYVVNRQSDDITVVNPENTPELRTIPVGSFPVAIELNDRKREAYVANFNSGDVTVIDTQHLTVTGRISATPSISDISVDAFSDILYCINQNFDYIYMIKPAVGVDLAEISMGKFPSRITLDPQNAFLYVTCRDDNSIAVVNKGAWRIEHTIASGRKPYMVVLP